MSKGRIFAMTAIVVGIALATGAMLSDLRMVFDAAMVAVAVFAFLPFVAGAAIFLLFFAISFLLALGHHDGHAIAEGGGRLTIWTVAKAPRYYRWMARQRHPVFWGVVTGVAFGVLLSAAAIAVVVWPGERRTAATLIAARDAIARYETEHGRLPPEATPFVLDGVPFVDGFGRPLRYDRSGVWKLAQYRLVSLGYDGRPGGDDLCISGSTRLVAWASQKVGSSIAALVALRCD